MALSIGFTGREMSRQQDRWAQNLVAQLPPGSMIHHGGCVGADEDFHCIARSAGHFVTVHPPAIPTLRMPHDPNAVWLDDKPDFDRDRDIVDAVEWLIATPDGPPRAGSRTWYTVDYSLERGVPVSICYPNGRVEER